jgi:APA family basic amino acid/polyamine antiporter
VYQNGESIWAQCIWASACALTGKYGDLLGFCGDYCTGVLHLDDIRILFCAKKNASNVERP